MKNIMTRTNYRTESGQLVYTDGNDYFTCEMIIKSITLDGKSKSITYHDYHRVPANQNLLTYPRSLKA